jgi:hypothetical protein
MSLIEIVPPAFAKLDLPPLEEYQKRKVALISGMGVSVGGGAVMTFGNRHYGAGWLLFVSARLDGACDIALMHAIT